MSNAENLLGRAIADGKIMLTVDEPTRTIKYDGGNLILGVKGDYAAERVYFKGPKYVYQEVKSVQYQHNIKLSVEDTVYNGFYDIYFSVLSDTESEEITSFSDLYNKLGLTDSSQRISLTELRLVTSYDPYIYNLITGTSLSYYSIRIIDSTSGEMTRAGIAPLSINADTLRGISDNVSLLTEYETAIDLTSENTKIYVKYENSAYSTYFTECRKEGSSDEEFEFSWLLSENVTVEKGTVKFNVCVKNVDPETGELLNEWHTTTFTGTVLDSIDVDGDTPEVVTSDSVTVDALRVKVNGYKEQVATYAENIDNLNKSLQDTEEYINTKVTEELANKNVGVTYIGNYNVTYFDSSNDYLADIKTPGVYSFSVNDRQRNTYYILVVDNFYGRLVQTVYSNMSTDPTLMIRTFDTSTNTWSGVESRGLSTINYVSNVVNTVNNKIGVTYLGEYDDFNIFFDKTNDPLASVTESGIYSFSQKSTSVKDLYYILIVGNYSGSIVQTVVLNSAFEDPSMYTRTSTDGGTTWEVGSQRTIAYKSDLSNYIPKPTVDKWEDSTFYELFRCDVYNTEGYHTTETTIGTDSTHRIKLSAPIKHGDRVKIYLEDAHSGTTFAGVIDFEVRDSYDENSSKTFVQGSGTLMVNNGEYAGIIIGATLFDTTLYFGVYTIIENRSQESITLKRVEVIHNS